MEFVKAFDIRDEPLNNLFSFRYDIIADFLINIDRDSADVLLILSERFFDVSLQTSIELPLSILLDLSIV